MTAIERAKEIIGNDVTVENIEDFLENWDAEDGSYQFLCRVRDHLDDGDPLPPVPVTTLPFPLLDPCIEIREDGGYQFEYDIYDLETFNALKGKLKAFWVEVDGIAPEACREFNGFEQLAGYWTAEPMLFELENYFKIILDK